MKKVGVILALLLSCGLAARAQIRSVNAELQLDQSDYLPDEDMKVRLRITNRSGQPLALGQTDDWVAFSVQGLDGFLVNKIGEMPTSAPFALESGMMATRDFNPTPYFEMRQPGRYFLSATIKIPQWNQKLTCKAVAFNIASGVAVPGMDSIDFGMAPAPGATNAAPDTRRYTLLKVNTESELALYFRLTDSRGKTLRCLRLARMLSFSQPEAQLDRFNNLHVLTQVGAKDFTYATLTPNGDLLIRQTYVYTDTRPHLKQNDKGNIGVVGGVRRYSATTDIPSPAPESAQK